MSIAQSPVELPGPVWARLCERLEADYPGLKREDIAHHVVEAHRAVEMFGLPLDERLAMVERLTRQQLRERSGEVIPTARLDPEVHVRARKQASPPIVGG